MKKLIIFCYCSFLFCSASKAENIYKLNAQKVNLLFEQAEELNPSEIQLRIYTASNPLSPKKILRDEKKITAGILGILLGGFAVHRFYLGHTRAALLGYCLPSVCFGLGYIPGIIDGILYLTSSDDEFSKKYKTNPSVYVWLN